MGVPGNANALLLRSAAAPTGYQISRSLRFNSADSAYLSRTPASAGNRKTWTWAAWVKRASLGRHVLFSAYIDGSNYTFFQFTSSDQLAFEPYTNAVTTAVFRDFSAWYHIVCTVDTTQATQANRVKIYVNGTQQVLSTSTGIGLNADTAVNAATIHNIASGYYGSPGVYTNGYLADVHLVDGQALDPTSFGETDATTGVWNPKAYTGSYGTNGFHLEFADNSAATATTLGKDTSGNGNNWTPNNLSVTAGAGNDSLVDSPTNYGTNTGAGGEVRGNYCTWNPLNIAGGALSNGNLDLTNTGGGRKVGTIGVSSGKWYWEVTITSAGDAMVGIMPPSNPASTGSANYLGGVAGEYGYYASNGQKYNNATATSYGATFTNGDVIGVALDLDAGTLIFYKNGVSQGTAFSSLTGTFAPGVSAGGSSGASITANFGQRPFAYTAPSGFKALCTQNLPAPVVTKPSTVMDVALWTGNGSARSITGLAFNPDLVWIKGRSGATDHALYDAVRGVQIDLVSNSTAAETTQTQGLTAFNSDGFSLGTLAKVNTSSATYAGWTWDAGSSTVTNTSGSISSQVRANASAGFSVVTYTGTGANATVGHGLGVAPGMVIVKRRDTTSNWQVRHTSIAAANSIQLNLTNAAASATTVWNSTVPSSTVFSIGTDATVNASGGTYVVYCFAPVSGYSSFGSITSNGTSDNAFAYLGFRPRFLLYKNASATGNWGMYDSSRDPENVCDNLLLASSSNAELTSVEFDFLSNGIKLRYPYTNGNQIVFAAFAESPFNYSRAR